MNTVLEILQLGLSGFVFMLLYLAYRLHAKALGGKNITAEKLRAVNIYTVLVLVAIIVVASINVWSAYAKPRDGAGACRDSLSRLDTSSAQIGSTATDLRAFIKIHVSVCRDVLERLDER